MSHRITRRSALKVLGGLAGAFLTPSAALAQPRNVDQRPGGVPPQESLPVTHLTVSVHKPGGDHLEQEALVVLSNGEEIKLRRIAPKLTYEANVEPGSHRVVVKAEGFPEVDYRINVPPRGLALPVYLGQAGWPWFRIGQSVIPFDPWDDLLGIAFAGKGPSKARWPALLQQMERMGLVPHPDRASYLVAGGSIALFRSTRGKIFTSSAEQQITADVVENVSLLFGADTARVGLPIDVRPGHVKILDNAYVVRFGSERAPVDVRNLACRLDATASPVSVAPNTWLFRFNERNNYRKHLSAVDKLASGENAAYAEPDLIVELQKHSCPDAGVAHSCSGAIASSATNDPWGKCQTNLALQGVPDAWCFLEQTLGPEVKRGSAQICIATVDSGINQGHPDLAAGLLNYVSLCDDCPDVPEDPHGMAVYGIVSAVPDNVKGTSGIAPGAHHTAIGLPTQWQNPELFSQILLWLSGVSSPVTFSQPPLARPADIISCSRSFPDLPTFSHIANALERLTSEGRPGPGGVALGTIVVCSAGDAGTDIMGTQALAADPNVIAVGDTLPPDSFGVERLWPDSNHGDRLDLCAQGENAPSLLADPSEVLPGQCTPSAPAAGAFEFFGTSAACPMVAATAALMLTANKNLAWSDVRDILRQTARCIDPDGGAWEGKRSYLYGSGRLDVHEAVKAAQHAAG